LGIRLLQRTTRSLMLTEDGAMMFYQRCQQILDELEAVELEVKQSRSQPKGTLRLNFSVAFGKMYIAPQLVQLAAQYPDLVHNRRQQTSSKDLRHRQKAVASGALSPVTKASVQYRDIDRRNQPGSL
jgi:DNA-binding transcriptional LysR family regulator